MQKHQAGVGADVLRSVFVVCDGVQLLGLCFQIRLAVFEHVERVVHLHDGHARLPSVGTLGIFPEKLFEMSGLRAQPFGQKLFPRGIVFGKPVGQGCRFVLQLFPRDSVVLSQSMRCDESGGEHEREELHGARFWVFHQSEASKRGARHFPAAAKTVDGSICERSLPGARST